MATYTGTASVSQKSEGSVTSLATDGVILFFVAVIFYIAGYKLRSQISRRRRET